MITIITKITISDSDDGSNLKQEELYFTTDLDVIKSINDGYDTTLGGFLATNRTKLEHGEVLLSSFFNEYESVHEARIQESELTNLKLTEITDVTQL